MTKTEMTGYQRIKKRIFDIIQIGNRGDIPSRAFDIFIVTVIIVNIITLFLDSFDEMATLALYTMIGENQKDSEPVTVGMVRDMIDKAIARSKSKKFPLFGKNQVGADGRIILREKDFAF